MAAPRIFQAASLLASLLLVAACVAQPGSSPSGTIPAPSAAEPATPSPEPTSVDVSRYFRDAILERSLPDAFDGHDLIKWSLNSVALHLLMPGLGDVPVGTAVALEAPVSIPGASGEVYEPGAFGIAWYAPLAGPPQDIAIRATWYPGLRDGDLRDAYLSAWRERNADLEATCTTEMVSGREVGRCQVGEEFDLSLRQITVYVHGETVYDLGWSDVSIASALPG